MSRARAFPPIEAPDARVLVLGTMPSVASLAAGEYYAHPRNAFWPILTLLLESRTTTVPPRLRAEEVPRAPYAERCRMLRRHHIAVWDVLEACVRPGSLDSAIVAESEEPNDFATFLVRHPRLVTIAFNGGKAEQLFRRHVTPLMGARLDALERLRLPSTSPAHAGRNFAEKLRTWSVLLERLA